MIYSSDKLGGLRPLGRVGSLIRNSDKAEEDSLFAVRGIKLSKSPRNLLAVHQVKYLNTLFLSSREQYVVCEVSSINTMTARNIIELNV